MVKLKKKLIAVFLFFMLLQLNAVAEQMMSVTVQETQVRERPSFLGKILAVLKYGDRLPVTAEQNEWARVLLPDGNEGWVHLSALTKKRIVLKAGEAEVSEAATSEEVALAGKGFNKEVENEYKKKHNLDYTWVDRMEEIEFPPDRLISFLKEGEVPVEGGGKE
ncbi:MAG: SH3 domain-containing protein [Spirochaetes bacterium]|nr:MAG: SH3 domain-containing protein [Spirochaetota bacterium]